MTLTSRVFSILRTKHTIFCRKTPPNEPHNNQQPASKLVSTCSIVLIYFRLLAIIQLSTPNLAYRINASFSCHRKGPRKKKCLRQNCRTFRGACGADLLRREIFRCGKPQQAPSSLLRNPTFSAGLLLIRNKSAGNVRFPNRGDGASCGLPQQKVPAGTKVGAEGENFWGALVFFTPCPSCEHCCNMCWQHLYHLQKTVSSDSYQSPR